MANVSKIIMPDGNVYDIDENVRQEYISTDVNHPLLFSYGDTTETTTKVAKAYMNNNTYVNPSTGVITANDFQIPTNTGAYYITECAEILQDILPDGVANRFELDVNVTQDAYQMHLIRLSASSFHIEGTASGQWDKKVGTITLHPGRWKMQANIDGGQDNFYFYAQGTSPLWRTNSTQSLSAATITIDTETTFNIYLRVASGYTVDKDVKFGIGLYREQLFIGAAASMVDHALNNAELTTTAGNLVDRGAKNLAWSIGTTSSSNNIQFTAYANGSFGVKATNSSGPSSPLFYYCARVTVQPGTYVLSGGISSTVKLYDGDTWSSEGAPSIKTFTEETTFRLYIRVNNGYNKQTEVIVKPMVCTLKDFKLSSAYIDYSMTNTELTTLCGEFADRGAKNLANYTVWRDNVSVNRGTKSIASNGAITITATGTDCYTDQTFSSSALLPCRISVTPGQTYIATWTSTNTGSGDKYFYMFPNGSSTGAIAAKSTDQMCIFTSPADCTYLTWRIGVSTSGDTVSYNNFMICTLESWKASSVYRSYGMSNPELTTNLITVESNISDLQTRMTAAETKLTLQKASATVSNVTTLTATGVNLDIPANSGYWEVFAVVRMSSAAPQIIEIRTTQDSASTEYLVGRTDVTGISPNHLYLTCRSILDTDSHVLHLKTYVKMASTAAGSPKVSLIARKLGI